MQFSSYDDFKNCQLQKIQVQDKGFLCRIFTRDSKCGHGVTMTCLNYLPVHPPPGPCSRL